MIVAAHISYLLQVATPKVREEGSPQLTGARHARLPLATTTSHRLYVPLRFVEGDPLATFEILCIDTVRTLEPDDLLGVNTFIALRVSTINFAESSGPS